MAQAAIIGQIGYAISARNFTTTIGIDPDAGAQTIDTGENLMTADRCCGIVSG